MARFCKKPPILLVCGSLCSASVPDSTSAARSFVASKFCSRSSAKTPCVPMRATMSYKPTMKLLEVKKGLPSPSESPVSLMTRPTAYNSLIKCCAQSSLFPVLRTPTNTVQMYESESMVDDTRPQACELLHMADTARVRGRGVFLLYPPHGTGMSQIAQSSRVIVITHSGE